MPDRLEADITHPSVSQHGDLNVGQGPLKGFLTPHVVRSTTTVGLTLKRTGGGNTSENVVIPQFMTPKLEVVNIIPP